MSQLLKKPRIMSSPTSGVLLLGSLPLASSEESFRAALAAVPGRLERIPDGETGFRGNFIGFQHPVFPIDTVQPRWGGQPSSQKTHKVSDLGSTKYDDFALESFEVFQRLQNAGTIPPDTRFQVCFPSPLGVVRGFIESDHCAAIEPLYEEKLLEAVRRVQDNIPASKLSIQWDLPFEIGMIEYSHGRFEDPYYEPWFSNTDVVPAILERVVRLASAVDVEVDLGFHLCYGDMGHVHFVEPGNTGLLVDFANAIVQKVSSVHAIKYVHMPVPKSRTDAAYYAPLRNLQLNDTKLYLGLIHPNDAEGTRQRIEAAKGAYHGSFGVASECGLGRTSKEELDSILVIAKAVT